MGVRIVCCGGTPEFWSCIGQTELGFSLYTVPLLSVRSWMYQVETNGRLEPILVNIQAKSVQQSDYSLYIEEKPSISNGGGVNK